MNTGNAYLVYDVDGVTASALDVETDPAALIEAPDSYRAIASY